MANDVHAGHLDAASSMYFYQSEPFQPRKCLSHGCAPHRQLGSKIALRQHQAGRQLPCNDPLLQKLKRLIRERLCSSKALCLLYWGGLLSSAFRLFSIDPVVMSVAGSALLF